MQKNAKIGNFFKWFLAPEFSSILVLSHVEPRCSKVNLGSFFRFIMFLNHFKSFITHIFPFELEKVSETVGPTKTFKTCLKWEILAILRFFDAVWQKKWPQLPRKVSKILLDTGIVFRGCYLPLNWRGLTYKALVSCIFQSKIEKHLSNSFWAVFWAAPKCWKIAFWGCF